MFGVGGLMGVRVATSVVLGTAVNFLVLAPIMIARGDIAPRIGTDRRDRRAQPRRDRQSMVSLVGRDHDGGRLVDRARRQAGNFHQPLQKPARKEERADQAKTSWRGSSCRSGFRMSASRSSACSAAWLTHLFFGVPIGLALLSLPLVIVLTVICVNSMALTSWTPTSSLAKITQFSIGAIDRANPASNLITAGMTAEVASNAGNLLSDIKPGYMLGAKPRQQAIGHCIGILSGALAATPLFFLLFLPPGDGWQPQSGHDRLRAISHAFRRAMERRGRPDRARRGQPADLRDHFDDRRRRSSPPSSRS